MEIKVYCEFERFSGTSKFYIFQIDHNGRRSICTSIDDMTFEVVPEATRTDPTFTLPFGVSQPFLQAMANELKVMGITADGEEIAENEMKAVKYHLEDMRSLVFNKEKENE